MDGLKLTFQRGGVIYVKLNDISKNTKNSILDILPINVEILHTRWCGREIYANITTKKSPPKENQTTIVSKFDVTYWREWEMGQDGVKAPTEAISLFYGPELLRYHGGLLTVNIIGRVLEEQESLLEEIGLRVWKSGKESVNIEYHKL